MKAELEADNARMERVERILKLQAINQSLSLESHILDNDQEQLVLLLQVSWSDKQRAR